MSKSKYLNRRQLLKEIAGTATSTMLFPYIVPSSAMGKANSIAPSERIALGIIGLGSRGSSHIKTLLPIAKAQILAVCDPYQSKCDQEKKHIENFYADKNVSKTYKGCNTYTDFREIISRKDIDAVFIASPEHWHGLQMVMAAKSGKDVYGEKALTLTNADGRVVCDTVRRYGCIFQVGLQQRSSREFRFACELARNGYLGKLHTVKVGVPGGQTLPNAPTVSIPAGLDYDIWLGPAPFTPYNELKCTYNWYFIYDYCVGWIQSWGVHHIDIAQWGAPSLRSGRLQVEGTAVFPAEGLADTSLTWKVDFFTQDGLRVNFTDNKKNEQGCRFEGDEGWVHVDRGSISAEPKSLLVVSIKPDEEHLYESNDHHANFLDCVRSRRDPAAAVEVGHTATTLTVIADIATRLGRKLTWDWQSQHFVDDERANRMLKRSMRSPWRL